MEDQTLQGVNTLKDLRLRRNKTLAEVGLRLGICKSHVHYIEKALRPLTLERASQFAKLYDVPLDIIWKLHRRSLNRRKRERENA